MHRLRRFLHQNKKELIKILGMIVFILLIIQVLNFVVAKKNNEEIANMIANKNNVNSNNITQEETKKGLVSDKSAITGQEVSSEDLKSATDTIYKFINYCNQKEIENAYNLLTDECKNNVFPTIESFNTGYYKTIFNGQKKNCTIENWTDDTYKVNIKEDMLSTGKASEYSKQDYITVEEVGKDYKLNINNYIGETQINEKTTDDNISMEVISKNTYKDFEEYKIKVTNNTGSLIQLDTVNSAKTLYLEDSKGATYSYYNHELTDQTLTVANGQTKEVTIKFYSTFVSTKNIKSIVFSNIILIDGEITEQIEFKANV